MPENVEYLMEAESGNSAIEGEASSIEDTTQDYFEGIPENEDSSDLPSERGLDHISLMDGEKIDNHVDKIADKIIETGIHEGWEEMPPQERMEQCDEIFEIFSDELGIETEFQIDDLSDDPEGIVVGKFICSYYSTKITLDVTHVKTASFMDVFGTIAHECRHAYQYQCIEKGTEGLSKDHADETNRWKPFFENYDENLNLGFEKYHYDPTEQDAREYANKIVISTLKKGGNE